MGLGGRSARHNNHDSLDGAHYDIDFFLPFSLKHLNGAVYPAEGVAKRQIPSRPDCKKYFEFRLKFAKSMMNI